MKTFCCFAVRLVSFLGGVVSPKVMVFIVYDQVRSPLPMLETYSLKPTGVSDASPFVAHVLLVSGFSEIAPSVVEGIHVLVVDV